MKLIHSDEERDWYLVEEWVAKADLKAQVLKCEWNKKMREDLEKRLGFKSSLHDFYTGYVQFPDDIKLKTQEEYGKELDVHGGVTFMGKLKNEEGMWIGFDMAHIGDENNQDLEYAKGQCEKLAEQVKPLEEVINIK